MISLPRMLERAVRLSGDNRSTTFAGQTRSWNEVGERVARAAAGLQSLGLTEGDRVALLSLNRDTYYESLFAVPWAGFCVVPLNTRWALPENEYAVGDSGSRVIMFDEAFAEQTQQLLETLDCVEHAIYIGTGACPHWAKSYQDLIESSSAVAPSSRADDDMLGIFYTGGTTGFPKGVMQSHRAVWASAVGALPGFRMSREDRYLHVAPMFHMADLAGSMSVTLSCCSHVMLPAFDPTVVLETIEQEKVSHVLMVPAMIKMVLNHPNAASADVSSLKCIMYGASPMPAATLEQCMKLWPHVSLVQAYGQTELAPIVTVLPAEDHLKGGELLKSAGVPTCINDVRVVDESGEDCPTGSPGEIVVRGANAMLGYWNKPEETAKALRDGWVYTGDAGYFGDTGHLYIVDRVKDMVVTGGENVFTTEVENAVMSHPAVQDVAVIGIPSEEWGEAVHAEVILHPDQNVSEAELQAHCRERIAGYKVPKSIAIRTEPMPLSGAGKVLKTELRKPYWDGQERQVG